MAFYHFLAMFPSLLLFLAGCRYIPHLGGEMKHALTELSAQVLPGQASQMLGQTVDELEKRADSVHELLAASAGALWAAFNGTWAMIYGLNQAYEVEERRSPLRLGLTIVALTLSLAVCGTAAVFLVFGSTRLGWNNGSSVGLHALEWIVLVALLSFSFALLYRFAPNLRDHKWRWSTPGALFALICWVGSAVAVRFYFNHVSDYARSYGHLNGVVMLLLWLYVTNGCILIGGEMNSEIEKGAAEASGKASANGGGRDRSGS